MKDLNYKGFLIGTRIKNNKLYISVNDFMLFALLSDATKAIDKVRKMKRGKK